MSERKFERIAIQALSKVRHGMDPEAAWLATLHELYSPDKVVNQVNHTCPKWAFCGLCNGGFINGIAAGCCPAAEKSNSAAFATRAIGLIQSDRSLTANKSKLERLIFGNPESTDYRTPNDELDVLLALLKAGELELQRASFPR